MRLVVVSKSIEKPNYWQDSTKNQKPIRYNLAQLLTQLRQDANVTQAQLAKRIGRSSSYISKIENEKTEPGTGIYLYMLKKLGYSFDVNP